MFVCVRLVGGESAETFQECLAVFILACGYVRVWYMRVCVCVLLFVGLWMCMCACMRHIVCNLHTRDTAHRHRDYDA